MLGSTSGEGCRVPRSGEEEPGVDIIVFEGCPSGPGAFVVAQEELERGGVGAGDGREVYACYFRAGEGR